MKTYISIVSVKKVSVLVVLLFSLQTNTFSQKLDEIIGNYTGVNAKGFFQPLANSLTSTFNTGQVSRAAIDSGFHLYIGVVATQTHIFGDELKYFTAQTSPPFQPTQEATASTILGPSKIVTVQGTNGTAYTFPAGLGVKYFLLAVPQITVGNFFGTEISARFFTYKVNEEFGKIQIMGGGLRHDFGRYFLPKKSKIHLSAELYYQQLKTGIYSDTKIMKAGVYAGQQTKMFHYYLYAGYQQGTMNVNYTNAEENTKVNVHLTSENPLLVGVGVGIKLSIFRLHAQANFISPVVLAAGFGFNF